MKKKDFEKAGFSRKDVGLLDALTNSMPDVKAVPIFDCWLCSKQRVWLEGGYEDPRNDPHYKWTKDSRAPICKPCREEHGKEIFTLAEVNEFFGLDADCGISGIINEDIK